MTSSRPCNFESIKWTTATKTIGYQEGSDELEVVLEALASNTRSMQLISSGCLMKRMSVRCNSLTLSLKYTPACGCDAVTAQTLHMLLQIDPL